jgi:hypothetical protein
MCDLIYHGFHLLLLRRHALLKEDRLSHPNAAPNQTQNTSSTQGDKQPKSKYPILQPIIDLLQYQVFLDRIQSEVIQVVRALQVAGIPTQLTMNTVGGTGTELVKFLDSTVSLSVGGEIVLRIFNQYDTFPFAMITTIDNLQAHDPLHFRVAFNTRCPSLAIDAESLIHPSIMPTSHGRSRAVLTKSYY